MEIAISKEITLIKDLFEKYQIEYEKTVVPQLLLNIVQVDGIIDFLSCLGKDVKLNLSSYGVAHTLFYSVSNNMLNCLLP